MFNLHKLKRCDIQFELDNGGVFEAGNTVSGTVVITAKQDINSEKLLIQYHWRTTGIGRKDVGEWQHKTIELTHKNLLANEIQHIPFSIQAPNGPITYQGHALNIEWTIKATLESRGFLDPTHTKSFVILPKILDKPYVGNYEKRSSVREKKFLSILSFFLGSFFFVGVGGLLLAILFSFLNLPFYLAFAILLAVYVLRILPTVKFIRTMFLQQGLGPIKAQVSKTKLLPDEALVCQLSFRPIKNVLENKVVFKLRAVERVNVDSKQTDGYFEKVHELFSEEHVELVLSDTDSVVELEHHFQLPSNAPYSFTASDNSLDWYCEVSIETNKGSSWTKKLPLEVVPWHAQEVSPQLQSQDDWTEGTATGLV